jgi:hypothetical protein
MLQQKTQKIQVLLIKGTYPFVRSQTWGYLYEPVIIGKRYSIIPCISVMCNQACQTRQFIKTVRINCHCVGKVKMAKIHETSREGEEGILFNIFKGFGGYHRTNRGNHLWINKHQRRGLSSEGHQS